MPGLGDRLLVRRYDPGSQAEEVPKKKRKGVKGVKVAKKQLVEVAPSFARIFKGGPQRQKSDLPVQEDEGFQEVPGETSTSQETATGLSWLSSLEDSEPKAELDWLSSLKATKPKPKEVSKPSKSVETFQVKSDDGQALPIPPFWRTATAEELEKQLLKLRETMLPRIRRLAKDAHRAEQKRGGHLKPRHVRV
mmetsp:Transcript_67665/g.148450  ORF Transcript_67665/g.148450 Transcript_67665/m.148450 type:complete len:193 (-) Transcript_67665:74-652(-)